jgi:hypothetical protein
MNFPPKISIFLFGFVEIIFIELLLAFLILKVFGTVKGKGKGNTITLQAWTGPEGYKSLSAPRFQDIQHMKVVRMFALRTDRLYPPEIFLVLIFVRD